jgi:hypothetical protein
MDLNSKSSSRFTLGETGFPVDKIFPIPEGYFHDLETRVLSLIALENFESTIHLNYVYSSPKDIFSIHETGLKGPSESYFDSLKTKIFSKIDRYETENEFLDPILHDELIHTRYSIPDQYFSDLSGKILREIENPEILLEKFNLERSLPFSVPQDYFSNTSKNIRVRTESLGSLFPPQNPSSENQAPGLYGLVGRDEKNILNSSSPKRVPIFQKRIFQYMVAASLGLLAIFSGIQWRQSYLEKLSYPILSQEDRLKYRFGIDESVLEDELVSNGTNDSSIQMEQTLDKSKKDNSQNDRYLLSHPDSHTLLEEL